jgi:hypothetical protein
MKKNLFVRRAIAAACFAAFAASGAVLAADEVEPNNSLAEAQVLQFDSGGVALVNAFMGDADADLFSFQAKQGDVVTFDIDGGAKNYGPGHIDTQISVLKPESGRYIVMDSNDDAPLDEGSVGIEDSYLTVTIPADGVYYVGVAGVSNLVVDDGVCRCSPGNLTGTYTLIVSGVSPVVTDPVPEPEPAPGEPEPEPDPGPITSPFPEEELDVLNVAIDIKPGLKRIARIDPRSRREIPVAILGGRGFDVRKVDVNSLTFGRTGDEQSLKRCKPHPVRINRDRRPDLLCFFENQQAAFETTDDRGVLKGMTVDGKPFQGEGMLKVIAEKRKSNHRHRNDRRHNDRKRR